MPPISTADIRVPIIPEAPAPIIEVVPDDSHVLPAETLASTKKRWAGEQKNKLRTARVPKAGPGAPGPSGPPPAEPIYIPPQDIPLTPGPMTPVISVIPPAAQLSPAPVVDIYPPGHTESWGSWQG